VQPAGPPPIIRMSHSTIESDIWRVVVRGVVGVVVRVWGVEKGVGVKAWVVWGSVIRARRHPVLAINCIVAIPLNIIL